MEIGLGSIPLLGSMDGIVIGGIEEIQFLLGDGGSGVKPERGNEVLMSAGNEINSSCSLAYLLW